MPIPILMPALSPTMEQGKLAKWLVKEGDTVASGDVIAEIETDKATMEVEAVEEGTVGRILVPEGTDGVAVNATIAILLGEGEDKSALDAAPKAAAREEPRPLQPRRKRRAKRAAGRGEGRNRARQDQWREWSRRAHFRLAARPPRRQGKGRRSRRAERQRAAWPRRRPRY